jgi:predicted dehydrogenase
MKVVIVGLGVQGRKRLAIAGVDVTATVDPVVSMASHRVLDDVPLEDYEAALVCTPDAMKLEVMRYLLRHGKHVLVEKPLLAADLNQLRELADLAQTTGAACYTAYNHRFEPHIARLKTILETDALGPLYLIRCFYGNGTARDVRHSPWRDQGMGVLADLGSHLLDIALFVFGQPAGVFEVWSANRFENKSLDHVLLGTTDPPVMALEGTMVSWRNTFTLDVYGERGSAHIHGLCKWGPSLLIVRQRVLPSGRPTEEVHRLACPDPTWALEYEHFKILCRTGGTNVANDVWIAGVLNELAHAQEVAG